MATCAGGGADCGLPVLPVLAVLAASGFSHRYPVFVAPKCRQQLQHGTRLFMTGTLSRLPINETRSTPVPLGKTDVLFPGAKLDTDGKIAEVLPLEIMRPPPDPSITAWDGIKSQLISNFDADPQELERITAEVEDDKDSLLKIYKSMQLSRQFELACNKQYMVSYHL